METKVVGVYPVSTPEPCHLIEMAILDADRDLDLGEFTQPLSDEPRSSWQVPYDETFLNELGDAPYDPEMPYLQPNTPDCRIAFFFHYLDVSKPLTTPGGPVRLPEQSPVPARLQFLRYEAP